MPESGRPPFSDIIALDFGLRRIGVAAGSLRSGRGTALKTIAATDGKPDWVQLDKLVGEWKPGILILGLPYNMDGTDSPMTARVLAFAAELGTRYGLAVETVDERLTSHEAGALLKEQRRSGMRSKRLKAGDIDALAAQLIAESWLGQHKIPAH